MALAPLRQFGLKTSFHVAEAISGAVSGRAVVGLLGNVIPFTAAARGRIETETNKISAR